MNISAFPNELFVKILSFHTGSDFCGLSRASKKCRILFFAAIQEISCHSIEPIKAFGNAISQCKSLRSIEFPNNHQWAVEIFPKLNHSIEALTLSTHSDSTRRTKITDSDLEALSRITSLTTLNLACSGLISDKGVAHLTRLEKITNLNLYGCQELTNGLMPLLSHFTALQNLTLSGCHKITSQGLAEFLPPPPLTKLELLYCNSIDDRAVRNLIERKKSLSIITKST